MHPDALFSFLVELGAEMQWLQVWVERRGRGFELRHHRDRDCPPGTLRVVRVHELRSLADLDARGGFRPLKASPDLVRGWQCDIETPEALGVAIDHLYPGSIDDWWHFKRGSATPAEFAAVAGRQLGKGKSLRNLQGEALSAVVTAGCSTAFCLKHRRWGGAGVPVDDGVGKSKVPCLEPCPSFLAFARTCARAEESPTVTAVLAPEDLATLAAALRHAIEHPPEGIRAGESGAPLHPRRVARVLERHAALWARAPMDAGDGEAERSSA